MGVEIDETPDVRTAGARRAIRHVRKKIDVVAGKYAGESTRAGRGAGIRLQCAPRVRQLGGGVAIEALAVGDRAKSTGGEIAGKLVRDTQEDGAWLGLHVNRAAD